MANIPLPAPLNLRDNIAGEWRRFKNQWQNYEIATDLTEATEAKRAAIFLTCIGTEAYERFMSFDLSPEDAKKVTTIIQAFDRYCEGEVNVTYERYTFNRRDQEPGESFDVYLGHVRILIKTCAYGDIEDSILRDRIVLGIRDDATRKRLLQTRSLDLKQTIDICRSNEIASKQLKHITGNDSDNVNAMSHNSSRNVHTARSSRSYSKSNTDSKRNRSKTPDSVCRFCGKRHNFNKRDCPAYGKQCNKCKRFNHFSSVCKSKDHTRTVHSVDSTDVNNEVLALDNTRDSRTYCRLFANDVSVRFLLDSGSSVNLIPVNTVKQMNNVQITPSNAKLRMFDGQLLNISGECDLIVRHPVTKHSESLKFYVTALHKVPLIGKDACVLFNLIRINEQNICTVSNNDKQCSITMSDIVSNYSDLFEGFGKLNGQIHLQTDPSIAPVRMPLRKIPVPIKDKVALELKRLQDNDIIEPVTGPTEWLSALLVVQKPNGGIRICIDPKPLNKALQRDHFPMPTLDDVLPKLTNAKLFSTVDVSNAFWHVELDNESSRLTAFETPFGKYKWKRLPFGISASPEIFQRRLIESLDGLNGIACIADDILVYGCGTTSADAKADHDRNFIALLKRCRELNIRLNIDKLKLHQTSVRFMGHELSSKGLIRDPSKVKAITEMPPPTDKQGLQRLLGMVTYLSRYVQNFSNITAPLRELLKSDNEFLWDDEYHGKALDSLKHSLVSSEALAYYDVSKPVVLQCDSSQSGLGAVLLQEGKPVEYASRALSDTEKSYSQIEKELLAILFGLERFHTYVYGRRITVETDHKPLITIVKKALTSAPKRLQRMLLRILTYDFNLIYKPGTQVIIADTLSRAYLPSCSEAIDFNAELAFVTDNDIENDMRMIASEQTISLLRDAARNDSNYNLLRNQVLLGWPEKLDSLPPEIREYTPFNDELSVCGEFVFKNDRIIIPVDARNAMLDRIHSNHIGINGCIRRAKDAIFWPNMSKNIRERVERCQICQEYQMSQTREPLMSHDIPSRPWEKVGIDIFTFRDYNYLLTVDYLSNYFEVDRLSTKRVCDIVYCLKQQFARHGIPDIVFSDNSPFNSREFKAFSANYEFRHETSSPRYPQSNGKVENAVKTVKRLMTKAVESNSDPFLALLDWRNTPSEGSMSSPVQVLYNRRTRSLLPYVHRLLETPRATEAMERSRAAKTKQARYYNRNTREKPELQEGQTVRFQVHEGSEWRKGEVTRVLPHRSYDIKAEDGSVKRRTSKHVRFSREPPIVVDDYSVDSAPFPVTQPDTLSTKPPKTTSHVRQGQSSHNYVTRSGRIVKPPQRYRQ